MRARHDEQPEVNADTNASARVPRPQIEPATAHPQPLVVADGFRVEGSAGRSIGRQPKPLPSSSAPESRPEQEVTFADLLPQALAVGAQRWSPGSRVRFEGVAVHYLARWSSWPLSSITRAAVLAWLREMTDAGVAVTTQVKAIAVFRAVWSEALTEGVVRAADPSLGLSMKKPPPIMGRSLNPTELTRLIGATDARTSMRSEMLVAAIMGLRWGEIAALTVGDFDQDFGQLQIRASLAKGRNGYQVKAPKTTSSLRTVPVPEVMMSGLRKLVIVHGGSGPLFRKPNGDRLDYSYSRRHLMAAADRAQIADCTGWHVLRRTAATLALRSGLNLKDVQALLGHSTPSQTLAAYVAAREMSSLSAPLNSLAQAAING